MGVLMVTKMLLLMDMVTNTATLRHRPSIILVTKMQANTPHQPLKEVLLVLTTVVETLHHNLVMDHPTLALVLTVLPTPDPALTVLPTPDPDLVLTVLPTLALAPVLMDHQLLVQVPVPLVDTVQARQLATLVLVPTLSRLVTILWIQRLLNCQNTCKRRLTMSSTRVTKLPSLNTNHKLVFYLAVFV